MEYLKNFKNVADANKAAAKGMLSPNTTTLDSVKSVNFITASTEKFTCTFDESGKAKEVKPYVPTPESWKIYYKTNDGNIITPNYTTAEYFGVNVVSNVYEDGKGCFTFDGPVTKISGNTTDSKGVFQSALTLTWVKIPSEVTAIGARAFKECPNLLSVEFNEGLEELGLSAFQQCGLTGMTFPNTLKTIGQQAFYGCSGYTSVDIPASVESIGTYAFTYSNGAVCLSLTSVTFHEGLKVLNQSAFMNANIKQIDLPSTVTNVGYACFWGNNNTEYVICRAVNVPEGGGQMFRSNIPAIKVPSESVSAYKAATYWITYKDVIVAL